MEEKGESKSVELVPQQVSQACVVAPAAPPESPPPPPADSGVFAAEVEERLAALLRPSSPVDCVAFGAQLTSAERRYPMAHVRRLRAHPPCDRCRPGVVAESSRAAFLTLAAASKAYRLVRRPGHAGVAAEAIRIGTPRHARVPYGTRTRPGPGPRGGVVSDGSCDSHRRARNVLITRASRTGRARRWIRQGPSQRQAPRARLVRDPRVPYRTRAAGGCDSTGPLGDIRRRSRPVLHTRASRMGRARGRPDASGPCGRRARPVRHTRASCTGGARQSRARSLRKLQRVARPSGVGAAWGWPQVTSASEVCFRSGGRLVLQQRI